MAMAWVAGIDMLLSGGVFRWFRLSLISCIKCIDWLCRCRCYGYEMIVSTCDGGCCIYDIWTASDNVKVVG